MASRFLRPGMGAPTAFVRVLRLSTGRTLRLAVTVSIGFFFSAAIASAQFLRVVAYNIQAGDGIDSNLTTVLQGIGNSHLAGHVQPIDVLALEELATSPTTTTLPFVINELNNIYGAGTYAFDSTADPTTGGTGGGPSGLVYNTKTVQVLGAAVIGSASGSGAPRAPMRYKLAPVGYNDHSADFWLYVSHMKANSGSGDQSTNIARRDVEAHTIRTNSASAAVGANAHVIYAGDFNVNDSTEAAYQTMISSTLPGIGAVGQAVDTLNPANDWDTSSPYPFKALFTETATFLQYRDDFQFVTNPMLTQPGMQLVANTLTAFGNGGSIAHTSVTSSGNSAALTDLANRSTVLTALTTATDHLPVVADYSFASAVGIPGDYDHSGLVNIADYTLWQTAFGSTTSLAADGNANGVVDAADYVVWRDHLGSFVPGAGAGAFGVPVPEPSAAVLLVVGGCLTGLSAVRLRGWTRTN